MPEETNHLPVKAATSGPRHHFFGYYDKLHFDSSGRYILTWARRHPVGDRFFLFEDKSKRAEVAGEGVLPGDGHCTYSPDRRWILTDTYPEKNMRALLLYHPAENLLIEIGRFYSPENLGEEIRCDLHPRWNRDGKEVSIDSAHEGSRQIYIFDVSEIVERWRQ